VDYARCAESIRLCDMSSNMAVDYWRGRAQAAHRREQELDEECAAARCRAGRAAARILAIAQAAEMLLAAVGERPPGDPLHAPAVLLRIALDDEFTHSMHAAIEEAVSICTATESARKMLAKMKVRDEIRIAATKWLFDRLRRRAISIERTYPENVRA
jgi:hypothetical protein